MITEEGTDEESDESGGKIGGESPGVDKEGVRQGDCAEHLCSGGRPGRRRGGIGLDCDVNGMLSLTVRTCRADIVGFS